jgi:hypothetical protein
MTKFSGCYDYDECAECGDLVKTEALDVNGLCDCCSGWDAGWDDAWRHDYQWTDAEADAAYEAAQEAGSVTGQYWGLL